jgi:phosphoesterase RecJ-like protein
MMTDGTRAADVAAFVAAMRGARRVTALCHENPDGDTLGAAVAISLAARRLGLDAEVVSVDPVPPAYQFLPGFAEVRREPGLEPDLAVVCDAATLNRVGSVLFDRAEWFAQATIANVDHHATNSWFGAVNVVDPQAAATCQIIAELLPELGVAQDEELATALLTGIVRDSQGFSTAATTSATLRAAADTVDAGAAIEDISRAVLLELPRGTMSLWGRLLNEMQTAYDGQVVHALLTPAALASTGTEQHDADGVVEFMARSQGARIAILFRELKASTRVSLRTAPDVDAAAIAGHFGGGGHVRRSGCTLPVPAAQAVELVLDACGPYLDGRGAAGGTAGGSGDAAGSVTR